MVYDGDLSLLVDNEIILKGVDKNCPIVMDIEDKVTALKEPVNKEHIIKLIFRTLDSSIGECSNCATSYHNKRPSTEEQYNKYQNYINLLSVITGKSIDSAKTGVRWNIPKYIAKYSKPLPYFMKYASPYYSTMTKWNKAWSNMNHLCIDIEKWEKKYVKFKKPDREFDHSIMIAPYIPVDDEKYKKIEKIYLEFCKEMEEVKKLASMCKDYSKYKSYFKENYPNTSQYELENWEPNWNYYYDKYKKMCKEICSDKQELANIVVSLCYVGHPSKSKKFMWKVAEDGILMNIFCKRIVLPSKDRLGSYNYLGKKFNMMEVYNNDL